MRTCRVFACIACLSCLALAQQPTAPAGTSQASPMGAVSADSALNQVFQAKIKAEWEALKNKDKNGYAELLADDYQGVEVDGKGERSKLQAVSELADTSAFTYTLWGFKLVPLGPDAAFVIYESTMQFPPKSQIRLSRVYITELWVKRAGQWKELHYQETHVK
ncbi:MAG: nuclear transport factor 2 family protein [Candidatus Sulfotelmatobacter sp.]